MRLFVRSEIIRQLGRRTVVFGVLAVVASLVLIGRLVGLQLMSGDRYYRLSEANFVNVMRVPAKRGRIFDSTGTELADSVSSYGVYITPAFVSNPDGLLIKLSSYLDLSNRQIVRLSKILRKTRGLSRFKEYLVKSHTDRKELTLLLSKRSELKGLVIRRTFKRFYPLGDLFVHAVGYVGTPTEKQLSKEKGIFRDTAIGKSGIEYTFDDYLRGHDGEKHIIVDARGVEKQNPELAKLIARDDVDPIPGLDLYTTLDHRLQEVARQAFERFEAGAVWAMNPKTGDILVAYSKPGFDPNLFVYGIPPKIWNKLRDDILHPLLNKGIQAAYFPGSTFKPLVAYAALAEHLVGSSDTVVCRGVRFLGKHPFRCWRHSGHGVVDLRKGLKQSCDVYFYELGSRLGIDKIEEYAHLFGLGAKTGIELPHEVAGIFPNKDWHKRIHKRPWTLGDTFNTSIGQGDVKITPVQLLEMYSALFNGGFVYKPRIVKAIKDRKGNLIKSIEPKLVRRIDIDDTAVELVRNALIAVVNERGGTAYRSRSSLVTIAGKTGTAQVVGMSKWGEKTDGHKEHRFLEQDHALFAGFAPAEDPQIVVVAIAEHGGHGSAVAPVVKAVIDAYFTNKAHDMSTSKTSR